MVPPQSTCCVLPRQHVYFCFRTGFNAALAAALEGNGLFATGLDARNLRVSTTPHDTRLGGPVGLSLGDFFTAPLFTAWLGLELPDVLAGSLPAAGSPTATFSFLALPAALLRTLSGTSSLALLALQQQGASCRAGKPLSQWFVGRNRKICIDFLLHFALLSRLGFRGLLGISCRGLRLRDPSFSCRLLHPSLRLSRRCACGLLFFRSLLH
mmetsp:Transcript_28993/g.63836  ORF Transcript_28993/g.63836 Transcript_28993/m.63836 type:complete len:211 (-) Transcript_28993:91-723(-)